ncbi:MAG: putative enoyl-CoA hydratase, partial [Alphaproteobacteria bacterium MarineAlpha3_Bin5]
MPDNANRKPTLLRHDSDGIVSLRLNRPDYNLLSIELLENLCRELENIALDKKIRVVVIESSGKAFCAGHDLAEMRRNPSKKYIKNLFETCSRMMIKITKIPQPVIAKVHGAAVAAGCQLVAQCDLAVASNR